MKVMRLEGELMLYRYVYGPLDGPTARELRTRSPIRDVTISKRSRVSRSRSPNRRSISRGRLENNENQSHHEKRYVGRSTSPNRASYRMDSSYKRVQSPLRQQRSPSRYRSPLRSLSRQRSPYNRQHSPYNQPSPNKGTYNGGDYSTGNQRQYQYGYGRGRSRGYNRGGRGNNRGGNRGNNHANNVGENNSSSGKNNSSNGKNTTKSGNINGNDGTSKAEKVFHDREAALQKELKQAYGVIDNYSKRLNQSVIDGSVHLNQEGKSSSPSTSCLAKDKVNSDKGDLSSTNKDYITSPSIP